VNFERTSARLKALGHPTRLRILCLLQKEGSCVQELEQKLDLRQSNVSQHLRILRDLDLVRVERTGQTVCYSLNTPLVCPILDTLESNDPDGVSVAPEGESS
jgi:DNA-binding transcriptional ArsR family regulator